MLGPMGENAAYVREATGVELHMCVKGHAAGCLVLTLVAPSGTPCQALSEALAMSTDIVHTAYGRIL